MAKTHGVSEAWVRRIWRRHALKPHHISTFKVSRDPQFVQILIGVVGLYLIHRIKRWYVLYRPISMLQVSWHLDGSSRVAITAYS